MSTINVQRFVRFFIFLVIMGILSAITFLVSIGLFGATVGVPVMFIVSFVNLFLSSVLSSMLYVLPEWHRLILLKLGKYVGTRGPGVFLVPPFIYSVGDVVDIRITTHQVEATATLTKDNVPTRATAAIEMEIEDPKKAVINVQNYFNSVTWLATEALKNTIGSMDLKELLSNREDIAESLREQIDKEAIIYGINVRAVRITDIDTPPELIEELAVIARARRAAQAKQIQAEAEVNVALKVAEASKILNKSEGGFKLREIQNMASMSKEESSMIIIYPYGDDSARNLAYATVAKPKPERKARVYKTT